VFVEIIMSEHDEQHEHGNAHEHQHHACGDLFGCGDEKGTGIIREDIRESAFGCRTSDRLLHMDEIGQEILDGYLSERGRLRRKFLQASTFMGALAAVQPWFAKLAHAEQAGSWLRQPMAKDVCTWCRAARHIGEATR
jgi:hypothetical protein